MEAQQSTATGVVARGVGYAAAAAAEPRFSTILVARSSSARPSGANADTIRIESAWLLFHAASETPFVLPFIPRVVFFSH